MAIAEQNNVVTRLADLKARAERGKTARARAEATLEQISKQKEQLYAELTALDIAPDQLDAVIAEIDEEIKGRLAEAEQLLRGVN
jgi:chromosome segregation ATPase